MRVKKIDELEDSFALGNLRLPKRPMYINFTGSSYEQISYWRVLAGEFPADFIKGKIVLVGATAKAMEDIRFTSFSKGIPLAAGIEIHADIIQTILKGNYITPLNRVGVIGLILLLSLLTAILIQGLKIKHEVIVIGLMLLNIAIACFSAFYHLHLQIPFIPLALVILLVAISVIFWKIFLVEQKLTEKILEFFKVAPKKGI